jgi:ferrous iron transport protein B
MGENQIHIALAGNPNSGKSSLFNCLTGLHQKVGNFPGVTVDKKTGYTSFHGKQKALVIDLPGSYSLYPRRNDEWVGYKVLLNPGEALSPDIIIVVADASNLKRNLLFCTQIMDLKRPVIIALTMMDLAKRKGIRINVAELEIQLGVPVIPINPRTDKGIPELKKTILAVLEKHQAAEKDFIDSKALATAPVEEIQAQIPSLSNYSAIHYLINHENFSLGRDMHEKIEGIERRNNFNHTRVQAEEILQRYNRIKEIMQLTVSEPHPEQKKLFTERLDDVFLHRFWGYIIMLVVLFLLFQSIFWLAQYPMGAIDFGFAKLNGALSGFLPANRWTDLLQNGILAGLNGILVFVPQIMILFGLITLLEDSGYMARISFLTDKLMRKVGLNGKSVMPMISGFACAVPAIMSARGIENRKERLLTILITPLMSCSARLPVYTILIGLVVPHRYLFGFLGLQGLVMMGLYLLGLVFGLIVSYVAQAFIKIKEKSFFILELPLYRPPRWKNIPAVMLSKARIFVTQAGKIIMIISLIIWSLSSFGPGNTLKNLDKEYAQKMQQPGSDQHNLSAELKAKKLQVSYAGLLGKTIEPVIKPLGYDWKIGIALVSSFAAREVFVGTMATLYSVGDDNKNSLELKEKMKQAKKEDGSPVFTLATALSLMIFYVFAMQCMSTLAVVKRETGGWKWPIIQVIYMTGLAYLMSWLVYNLFK